MFEQAVTLREAYQLHLTKLSRLQRSEITMGAYRYYLEDIFADLLDTPVKALRRTDMRLRHDAMSDSNGTYSANKAMKCLRAILNTYMKEFDDIVVNPTVAIHWHRERRRQEPIPAKDLPAWYAKVLTLENPVRRDLQLFTIFTGLRRNDAKTIRWDDLNFENASLHRPRPKGGQEWAFTIPMSDVCMSILVHRRQYNPAVYGAECPWVFPTVNNDGLVTHVVMPYEKRRKLPTPHRLRDTYTTAANAAGLTPYDIDVLTNHRPAQGSITAGYIRQDYEHLMIQQQRITDYLKAKMGWDEKVHS